MSRYAMVEADELAALRFYLGSAKRRDDDWAIVMWSVPVHPAAALGSAVDDAWIYALENNGKDGTR